MLKGKQRGYLKSLANPLEPVVFIGKDGLTNEVLSEIDRVLEKRELIKVKIQEGSTLDPKDTCSLVSNKLGAEFVQAMGRKFTLYRMAKEKEDRKIILPK